MVGKPLGSPLLLALGLGVVSSFALANARDWEIRYSLLPAFAGAEVANGRIVVQVTNLAAYPVAGLTLRLADQTQGRLTGAVQEEIDLKAGESRRLEGEFALKVGGSRQVITSTGSWSTTIQAGSRDSKWCVVIPTYCRSLRARRSMRIRVRPDPDRRPATPAAQVIAG